MSALAQLRHLYANMINGEVRDTASAKRIATGLLGPAIEELERAQGDAKECRHCGWMCAPNADPKRGWYPLEQIGKAIDKAKAPLASRDQQKENE